MDAGDPLAVDRDRLGAGQPELLDDRPDVGGRRPGSRTGSRRAGRLAPSPRAGGRARARAARSGRPRSAHCGQVVVDLADGGALPSPCALEVLDLGPQVEQVLLELVLLRLEAEGGLDERRSLLARVAGRAAPPTGAGPRSGSPRTRSATPRVTCQLATPNQRSGRARACLIRTAVSCRAAMTTTTITTTRTTKAPMRRSRSPPSQSTSPAPGCGRGGRAAGPAETGGTAADAAGAPEPPPGAGPTQSDGSGAGRGRLRPGAGHRPGTDRGQPGGLERRHVRRRAPRLNASSSVSPWRTNG